MNPIELGKFIATLRNEKNLTQEELAEKLYIDKRKISRWECGTSVPEFEMLINLSEILDVSLYELSICKRLPKEKISNNIINKFKGLKDFKKYSIKKIIKIVLLVIVAIFFLITAIYTFKYSGTVEIYDFYSLDERYYIDGNYLKTTDYIVLNIINITNNKSKKTIINESDVCDFDMSYNNRVFISFEQTNFNSIKRIVGYKKKNTIDNIDGIITFHAICYDKNKKQTKEYSFDFMLAKKYDNSLF